MKILAIDPGTEQSAYVVWDSEKQEIAEEGLDSSRFREHGIYANKVILTEQISDCDYDHAAIEMVASYGMAVGKTIFETCVWIGRFAQEISAQRNIEASFVYRKDIKMHFCNSTRAKDSNIRQALIDRFGEPGTKKAPGLLYGVKKDIWSALAVAIYYADTH